MNERVKELRKALGLTLQKFGDRVGVTKQTVSRIENGVNNVTDQMFKSIVREFNVNEQWLRTGEGKMFSGPGEDDVFLLAVKKASELDDVLSKSVFCHLVNAPQEFRDMLSQFFKDVCEELDNKND